MRKTLAWMQLFPTKQWQPLLLSSNFIQTQLDLHVHAYIYHYHTMWPTYMSAQNSWGSQYQTIYSKNKDSLIFSSLNHITPPQSPPILNITAVSDIYTYIGQWSQAVEASMHNESEDVETISPGGSAKRPCVQVFVHSMLMQGTIEWSISSWNLKHWQWSSTHYTCIIMICTYRNACIYY